MSARGYRSACRNRDVVLHALRNLPAPEFEAVAKLVPGAVDVALARTSCALLGLGIEPDVTLKNMAGERIRGRG